MITYRGFTLLSIEEKRFSTLKVMESSVTQTPDELHSHRPILLLEQLSDKSIKVLIETFHQLLMLNHNGVIVYLINIRHCLEIPVNEYEREGMYDR